MQNKFHIIVLLLVMVFIALLSFGQKDSSHCSRNGNKISFGINITPWAPSPFLIRNTGYYVDKTIDEKTFSYYFFYPHFSYKFLIKNQQKFIKIGVSFPGYLYALDYSPYLFLDKEIDFTNSVSWGKNKLNNKKLSFCVNKELIAGLKLYEWKQLDDYQSKGVLFKIGGGISYGFLFKLSEFIDLYLEQSFYINYSYSQYNYTYSLYSNISFPDTLVMQEKHYYQNTKSEHFIDFNFQKFLAVNCIFKLYGKEND